VLADRSKGRCGSEKGATSKCLPSCGAPIFEADEISAANAGGDGMKIIIGILVSGAWLLGSVDGTVTNATTASRTRRDDHAGPAWPDGMQTLGDVNPTPKKIQVQPESSARTGAASGGLFRRDVQHMLTPGSPPAASR